MPRRPRLHLGAVALAAAACALLLIAGSAGGTNQGITTVLLSRSTSGGLPNGPSGHPAISLDQRFASLLAFDSTATNLVSQTVGGGSNVYFIERAKPFDNTGGPWSGQPIQLASQAPGGQPANGPSSLPAVGGDNKNSPSCIAFISSASNLVPGDTNGKPDAFAYFPATQRTIRVSVNSKGRQANGSATEVSVNGRCTQFAFTDDATNLAGHPPPGVAEIYVHDLAAKRKVTVTITVRRHGRTHKHKKRKTVIGPLTTLVSAHGRHAGNAASSGPALAQATNDVVFASSATNLAGGTGGHSQVYGVGPRLGALHVLSAAHGVPGNGDSDQPAVAQNAKGYAFRTSAPSLAGSGPAQVYRVRIGGPSGVPGTASNAEMNHPVVRIMGFAILFESSGSNLSANPDGAKPPAGVVGCWRFPELVGADTLDSRDSNGQPLSSDCSDLTSSEAFNYVFFSTSDPFADRAFASSQGFDSDPAGTRQRAATDPSFHQVYLRYVGGQ